MVHCHFDHGNAGNAVGQAGQGERQDALEHVHRTSLGYVGIANGFLSLTG